MPGKRNKSKLVVGISGSPRMGGNTELLLDSALKGARSEGAATRKILLNSLSFKPCQECGGCASTGRCVLKDDMSGLYKVIDNADALIFASPIFFSNISAQAKAFIDRFQCRWVLYKVLGGRPVKKTRGAFFCTSGANNPAFFDGAKRVVKAFFNTLGIEYRYEIYCGGINQKDDILKYNDIIKKAYKVGASLAKNK